MSKTIKTKLFTNRLGELQEITDYIIPIMDIDTDDVITRYDNVTRIVNAQVNITLSDSDDNGYCSFELRTTKSNFIFNIDGDYVGVPIIAGTTMELSGLGSVIQFRYSKVDNKVYITGLSLANNGDLVEV